MLRHMNVIPSLSIFHFSRNAFLYAAHKNYMMANDFYFQSIQQGAQGNLAVTLVWAGAGQRRLLVPQQQQHVGDSASVAC